MQFYTGPIPQHELDHTRSGLHFALKDLHHEVGTDDVSEVRFRHSSLYEIK